MQKSKRKGHPLADARQAHSETSRDGTCDSRPEDSHAITDSPSREKANGDEGHDTANLAPREAAAPPHSGHSDVVASAPEGTATVGGDGSGSDVSAGDGNGNGHGRDQEHGHDRGHVGGTNHTLGVTSHGRYVLVAHFFAEPERMKSRDFVQMAKRLEEGNVKIVTHGLKDTPSPTCEGELPPEVDADGTVGNRPRKNTKDDPTIADPEFGVSRCVYVSLCDDWKECTGLRSMPDHRQRRWVGFASPMEVTASGLVQIWREAIKPPARLDDPHRVGGVEASAVRSNSKGKGKGKGNGNGNGERTRYDTGLKGGGPKAAWSDGSDSESDRTREEWSYTTDSDTGTSGGMTIESSTESEDSGDEGKGRGRNPTKSGGCSNVKCTHCGKPRPGVPPVGSVESSGRAKPVANGANGDARDLPHPARSPKIVSAPKSGKGDEACGQSSYEDEDEDEGEGEAECDEQENKKRAREGKKKEETMIEEKGKGKEERIGKERRKGKGRGAGKGEGKGKGRSESRDTRRRRHKPIPRMKFEVPEGGAWDGVPPILVVHVFADEATRRGRPYRKLIDDMQQRLLTISEHDLDDALDHARECPPWLPRVYVSICSDFHRCAWLMDSPKTEHNRWMSYLKPEDVDVFGLYHCWLAASAPTYRGPAPSNDWGNPVPGDSLGRRNFQKYPPRVWVFSSAYLSGEKILRPYESLRRQTYPNWRWVIFDDSSDGGKTYDYLVDKLRDPRVGIYKMSRRSGYIGAMKRMAASICQDRNGIVLELDHDDHIVEHCLETVVQTFADNPECGFAFSECCEPYVSDGRPHWYGWRFGYGYGVYWRQWDDVTMRVQNVARTPSTNSTTLTHLVGLPNHLRAWTWAAYVASGGHGEEDEVADDYHLMMRTFMTTRWVRIPEMLYIQWRNVGGDNQTVKRNDQIQELCDRMCDYYRPAVKDRLRELGMPDLDEHPRLGVSRYGDDDPAPPGLTIREQFGELVWDIEDPDDPRLKDCSLNAYEGKMRCRAFAFPLDEGACQKSLLGLRDALLDGHACGWKWFQIVCVGARVPEHDLAQMAARVPAGAIRWWPMEAEHGYDACMRYARLISSAKPEECNEPPEFLSLVGALPCGGDRNPASASSVAVPARGILGGGTGGGTTRASQGPTDAIDEGSAASSSSSSIEAVARIFGSDGSRGATAPPSSVLDDLPAHMQLAPTEAVSMESVCHNSDWETLAVRSGEGEGSDRVGIREASASTQCDVDESRAPERLASIAPVETSPEGGGDDGPKSVC